MHYARCHCSLQEVIWIRLPPTPRFPPDQRVTKQVQLQLVATLPQSRLTARQPTESDLSASFHRDSDASALISGWSGVGPRRLDTQAPPSIFKPPLPTCPHACAMNLPLFLVKDNLSTQACLKGVADLFILNTNATFWLILRAWVGTRHLPSGLSYDNFRVKEFFIFNEVKISLPAVLHFHYCLLCNWLLLKKKVFEAN